MKECKDKILFGKLQRISLWTSPWITEEERRIGCKQTEQLIVVDYDPESGNDCFGKGYNC